LVSREEGPAGPILLGGEFQIGKKRPGLSLRGEKRNNMKQKRRRKIRISLTTTKEDILICWDQRDPRGRKGKGKQGKKRQQVGGGKQSKMFLKKDGPCRGKSLSLRRREKTPCLPVRRKKKERGGGDGCLVLTQKVALWASKKERVALQYMMEEKRDVFGTTGKGVWPGGKKKASTCGETRKTHSDRGGPMSKG